MKLSKQLMLALSALVILVGLKGGSRAAGQFADTLGKSDSLSAYIENVRLTLIGRYGMRFQLDKNGIPISIEGELSKGITAIDPVEMAYQFFELNKDLYRIESPRDELIVKGIIEGGELGTTIKLGQVVGGIRVDSRGFILQYGRAKKLWCVDGQIDPDARQVDATPKITFEQAFQIALADTLDHGPKPVPLNQELVIMRFKDGLHLVWDFGMNTGRLPWHYTIDAHTGEILAVSIPIRK